MEPHRNPLLVDAELPAFSAITPGDVLPAIDSVLADYQACVAALLADPGARTFDSLLAPLERMEERLGRTFAPVSHLHGVKNSPELREAYAEALERITEHSTRLGQNRALYEAVQAVRDSAGFDSLDRAQRTLVEDSLRGFQLSGVALEEPQRSRFGEVQNALSQVQTEFENAVLDATDAWSRLLTQGDLAGLPDSARAMLAHAAKDRQQDGWLATLKGPSVQALLTFADSRNLRREVYEAYNTRASDQGPGAGAHDNSERIGRLLALRHEAAQLLGFASSAELSLVDKMAATPTRVLGFLRDLAARARPVAQRELQGLREFAASHLQIDDLQPWDVGYASEKLRERRFDFSEEDIKPYFPLPQVMAGLFALTTRVFGVHLVERTGALHERIIVLTVQTEPMPQVPEEKRFELTALRPSFWRLVVRYGFMEDRDVPSVLAAAVKDLHPKVELERVTYFLGREAVLGLSTGAMGQLAEGLFGYLQRNSVAADAAFNIPPAQAVEVGIQLDL